MSTVKETALSAHVSAAKLALSRPNVNRNATLGLRVAPKLSKACKPELAEFSQFKFELAESPLDSASSTLNWLNSASSSLNWLNSASSTLNWLNSASSGFVVLVGLVDLGLVGRPFIELIRPFERPIRPFQRPYKAL